MTIGRVDINEKDLSKICSAVIQLEERQDGVSDFWAGILNDPDASALSISGAVTTPGGRLTLVSATPVMTSTQSGKTTIYYSPYNGGFVPIYGGSTFTSTAFTELSVATSDTTKSPAAIGASKVNDWFVWSDSGTLRLGHGPDWTSDTARSAGTALVMVNGILLNSVSITNGPAASRGTYVGTTRSNGSSQLDWIYGANGAPPTAGFFGVWNAYNRVIVATQLGETTDSWTYGTATWRQANGQSSYRASYVCGLAEDAIDARHNSAVQGVTGTTNAACGIGVDSTTAFSGTTSVNGLTNNTATTPATYSGIPGLGFHFLAAIEYSFNGTSSFFGDLGSSAYTQTGLALIARM